MKYGIILDIDAEVITDHELPPKNQMDRWQVSEDGKSEEHKGWQHRKLYALLESDGELQELISHLVVHYDGEGYLLGAPTPTGFNMGDSPSMVFTYQDGEAEISVNVTPYPMPGENIPGVNTFKRLPLFGNRPFNERDTTRIFHHVAHSIVH